MNLNFQANLITEGKEKRLSGNDFYVVKEGYVVYPIDRLIEMKRSEHSNSIACVIVKEIQWKNNQTSVFYELKSLVSVN